MKKIFLLMVLYLGVASCVPMIYSTDNIREVYFLPTKKKISNDINDKFEDGCDSITTYLHNISREQNIRQYLINNGADCDTTVGVCYFYFIRKPQNNNDYHTVFEVSQYSLQDKLYRNLSTDGIAIPFQKSSKKAIKLIRTTNLFECNARNFSSNEEGEKMRNKYQDYMRKEINAN